MKREEFIEGIDFYFNEAGLTVMTEKYHLNRGFCCGNACRHCPFNYENVEKKKRKELVFKTKHENKKP